MLIVRMDDGSNFGWHVGRCRPNFSVPQLLSVRYVMADMDELDHLRAIFPSLPTRADRDSMIWFGDHAKFILANL
jgi:hypothetical protein